MAWQMLFGSDSGLLSLATIIMVIGIGAFLYRFVRRKMDKDSEAG